MAGTLAACVSLVSPRSGARYICPTANFLVRYTKKETNGELTEGLEEARVSAANYGRDEWWLLLDLVQEAEAGGSS